MEESVQNEGQDGDQEDSPQAMFNDIAGKTISTDKMAELLCPYSVHREKRHPPRNHPKADLEARAKENEKYVKSLSVQPVDLSEPPAPPKPKRNRIPKKEKPRAVAAQERNREDPRNAPLLRAMLGKESDAWHGVGANYWGKKDGGAARAIVPYCTQVYGSCECKVCRRRRMAEATTPPEQQGDCFAFFGADAAEEESSAHDLMQSPECREIVARGKAVTEARQRKEEAFWDKLGRHRRVDPDGPPGPSGTPSATAVASSSATVTDLEW